MKILFKILIMVGVLGVMAVQAQTPVMLGVRDATGYPYNLTAVFTPQAIYGYVFPSVSYGGAGIVVAATNGVIATNLNEGPYTITFKGIPKTLHVYVPGLWATNMIPGQTLPINLAVRTHWAMGAFQFIFVQTNSVVVTTAVTTSQVTNFYYFTNNLSGTNFAGLTNAIPTNTVSSITNQTYFYNTNYDAYGAATAAFASLLAGNNAFTGANTFSGGVTFTGGNTISFNGGLNFGALGALQRNGGGNVLTTAGVLFWPSSNLSFDNTSGQLFDNSGTKIFDSSGDTFTGTFSGNGSALTSLNFAAAFANDTIVSNGAISYATSAAAAVQNYATGVSNNVNTVSNTAAALSLNSSNSLYWFSAYLGSQIGKYTNTIHVSGGAAGDAVLNLDLRYCGGNGWTNGVVSLTNDAAGSRFIVSGTAFCGAIGGFPVGSAFTNINGSGTPPTTIFFTNSDIAGANMTIVNVDGAKTFSSAAGGSSATFQNSANIAWTTSGGNNVATVPPSTFDAFGAANSAFASLGISTTNLFGTVSNALVNFIMSNPVPALTNNPTTIPWTNFINYVGNAVGLTNLQASKLTGAVPLSGLANTFTNDQANGVDYTILKDWNGTPSSYFYSSKGGLMVGAKSSPGLNVPQDTGFQSGQFFTDDAGDSFYGWLCYGGFPDNEGRVWLGSTAYRDSSIPSSLGTNSVYEDANQNLVAIYKSAFSKTFTIIADQLQSGSVTSSIVNATTLIGNGSAITGLNDTVLSNALRTFSLTLGANGTNYANLIGQGNTNLSAIVSNALASFALTLGANGTNYANLIGQGNTNLSAIVSNALASFALTLGANGTNYANLIGQGNTNLSAIVSNALVSFTLTLSANGTNNTIMVSNQVYMTSLDGGATNTANTNVIFVFGQTLFGGFNTKYVYNGTTYRSTTAAFEYHFVGGQWGLYNNGDTALPFTQNGSTSIQSTNWSAPYGGMVTLFEGTTYSGNLYPALTAGSSTNTLVVTATGLTNNTGVSYLVSVTAGTSLAVYDASSSHNLFISPVLGMSFPLKPGWQFHGSGVTAIAVQDP